MEYVRASNKVRHISAGLDAVRYAPCLGEGFIQITFDHCEGTLSVSSVLSTLSKDWGIQGQI